MTDPRVLVIGLDPYRVPGPWDPAPMAERIEAGMARFAEAGVGAESCLVGLDGSDDIGAVVAAALRRRTWEVVVVGGGIRRDEEQVELFELVINLVRRHAAGAAIAFNSTPSGTFEAAARWLKVQSSVGVVRALVAGIEPGDDVEAAHRVQTLEWLGRTEDVFRRVKPATPDQHLVSYVVPVDPRDGAILLVDHVNAGLWLPPGGHVEPDEDPRLTAQREIAEELGLDGSGVSREPVFLTVTRTVGMDSGHTDVSLWYVLPCDREQALVVDEGEFHQVRWWSRAELSDADPGRFDPHFFRFLTKISAGSA